MVLKCKDFPEEDGEESVIFEHYELTQAGLNYNGKTKTNQDNYVFLESLFNIKHFVKEYIEGSYPCIIYVTNKNDVMCG